MLFLQVRTIKRLLCAVIEMNDRHHKWLIRLIYAISIATLLLIVCLGMFAYTADREVRKLQDSIKRIEESSDNAPNLPKNGYTPIKNIDYFDGEVGKNGQDSISTHTEKTVIKEVPIPGKDGKTPIKNVDYFDGKPGLMQETTVDIESCLLMTRYQGDESWTILAQLQKPCEVL